MNAILNQNLFFVKEHAAMFKASNSYDVLNPDTEQIILNCREEKPGFFTRILRFTNFDTSTPFHIEIKTPNGEKVLTIKKGISFFLSTVKVFDENEKLIGKFKQKLFSLKGRFDVFDAMDNYLCSLKSELISLDYRFIKNDVELALISKKWSGLQKELFTNADNYTLKINDQVPSNDSIRILIMAAVMCIDMVLKS